MTKTKNKMLLAHDLGTSGNKATLFTEEGQLVAAKTAAYETRYFNQTWAEQNPDDWWRAVCDSTRELLAEVDPRQIAVVALSGQMMGCTCVDRAGNPLRPSILYCDQRADREADSLLSKISMEDAYRIVGHRIAAVYSLEKLMWVKRNEPEVYARTHKMLCAKDYINFKLTGRMATDYSDASGTNAFDLNTMQWSDRMLELAEVDRAMFPEPLESIHVLGEITTEAAHATGLRRGTPVVVGAGDGSAASVGVGCVAPGSAYHYLGSSSWIGTTTDRMIFDPHMRIMNWAHAVPGQLHTVGAMQTAGSAYQWLKNEVCRSETHQAAEADQSPYELMNALVELSSPGAGGVVFLPHLLGERSPRWNSNARGTFVGMTLATRRADLVRAVMEGITYNLAIITDILRAHVGFDEITVIGGGAKGPVWLQMLADIFDVKIRRPNYLEEATSMGAAVVGGVGTGIFDRFDVIDRFLRIEETINPIEENQRRYEKMKPIFEATYQGLTDVFDQIAGLNFDE